APRSAAPVAPAPPARSATDAADDQDGEEDEQDHAESDRRPAAARSRGLRRYANAVERDATSLRDAADNAFRTQTQTITKLTAAEIRRHDFAARLTGEPVGDELLEAIAGLDPDLTLLHGQHDQNAVVLALFTDALAVVLEQLHRVLVDVAERLDRVHA